MHASLDQLQAAAPDDGEKHSKRVASVEALAFPPSGRRGRAGSILPPHQRPARREVKEFHMNNIIYIIGLIVVVMAVLAFVGLR